MPALRAFGRRWNLGSDDLVYPTVVELIVRNAWLVALIIVYFLEVDQYECPTGDKIKMFYIGTMVFLLLYLIINTAIATNSARSYIMEPDPRRHVAMLLYIKLAVFVPEIIWIIIGTLWTFNMEHNCNIVAVRLAKSAVVIEWIIIACLLMSIYAMFDPLGKRNVKQRSLRDYHQMWQGRCQFLCCCLRHDENRGDAFEEIASLLSNFFRGRDFVLTDTLAGVILLSVKQRYNRQMHPQFIVPVSEASTLQIRSCSRTEYLTHLPPAKPDLGAEQRKDSQSDLKSTHTSDEYQGSSNDSYPDPENGPDPDRRRSLGENSVNVGLDDRFYVESEEKRLYEASVTQVPDYGSSSTEDKESVQMEIIADSDPDTSASHQVKMRQHQKVATHTSRTAVASSRDSWMSSDSVFCPGFAPPTGPKSWMTLQNAAYYLRYSTAVYGSSNYAGGYNCGDRIPLCKKYRWCKNDPHLPEDVLFGDNYWECEASSVMLYANIDRDDIIYADLDNQIFKTPYVISRNDEKKNVVIAIRGTMSAGDALTDLTAEGQNVDVKHLPQGNVHSGILKAAKAMRDELQNKIHLKDKIPKGYSLVITGHSLGAGVATILSLLVRDQFPELTCFAFSPPGGLVSLPLSIYLQDFVLTCFLGMDVVARLSVINMENLKTDLLAIIKNSRLPKYKILSSGILAMCCGCLSTEDSLLLDDTQTTKLSLSRSNSVSSDWEHIDCADDTDMLVNKEDSTDMSRQSSDMATIQDSTHKADDVSIVNTLTRDSVDTTSTYSTQSSTHSTADSTYSVGSTAEGKRVFRNSSSQGSRTSKGHKKHKGNNRTSSYVTGKAMSASHSKWRKQQENKKVGLAATDPLYLPGQVLYLYEDEELFTEDCCNPMPVYKARWAQPEEFNSIQLHSKMMYHHNPYTVDEALQQILSQERYTPKLGLNSVVQNQPGKYAQPYDYDSNTIDSRIRTNSYDSGIEDGLMKQQQGVVDGHGEYLGKLNPAFEGSMSGDDIPEDVCIGGGRLEEINDMPLRSTSITMQSFRSSIRMKLQASDVGGTMDPVVTTSHDTCIPATTSDSMLPEFIPYRELLVSTNTEVFLPPGQSDRDDYILRETEELSTNTNDRYDNCDIVDDSVAIRHDITSSDSSVSDSDSVRSSPSPVDNNPDLVTVTNDIPEHRQNVLMPTQKVVPSSSDNVDADYLTESAKDEHDKQTEPLPAIDNYSTGSHISDLGHSSHPSTERQESSVDVESPKTICPTLDRLSHALDSLSPAPDNVQSDLSTPVGYPVTDIRDKPDVRRDYNFPDHTESPRAMADSARTTEVMSHLPDESHTEQELPHDVGLLSHVPEQLPHDPKHESCDPNSFPNDPEPLPHDQDPLEFAIQELPRDPEMVSHNPESIPHNLEPLECDLPTLPRTPEPLPLDLENTSHVPDVASPDAERRSRDTELTRGSFSPNLVASDKSEDDLVYFTI